MPLLARAAPAALQTLASTKQATQSWDDDRLDEALRVAMGDVTPSATPPSVKQSRRSFPVLTPLATTWEADEQSRDDAAIKSILAGSRGISQREVSGASLRVHIVSARGLRDADTGFFGQSDAYCVCEIEGRGDAAFETPAVKNSLVPRWDHVGDVHDFRPADTLMFTVWDRDPMKKDDFLGMAKLKAAQFLRQGRFEGSLDLMHKGRGLQGTLQVGLVVDDAEEGSEGSHPPDDTLAATLQGKAVEVCIVGARGLRDADSAMFGLSDAYCVCEVEGQPGSGFQTEEIKNSLNPRWNHTESIAGIFASDALLFTVWDTDPMKPDDCLGSVRLSAGQFLHRAFEGSLPLQQAGKGAEATLQVRVAPTGIDETVESNECFLSSDALVQRLWTWQSRQLRQGSSKTVAGAHGCGDDADQLDCPCGIAVDRDGAVIVADSGNSRVVLWQRGAMQAKVIAEAGAGNVVVRPFGIMLSPDGSVFYSDAEHDVVVRCWAQDGSLARTVVAGRAGRGGGRPEQLRGPAGLALAHDGRSLLIADCENHRVVLWRQGAAAGMTVAGGNGSGSRLDQLYFPSAVAVVGTSGAILVADTLNHRVVRWELGAAHGQVVAGGLGLGSCECRLSYPQGLALDTSGALLVADTANGRVMRWRRGGCGSPGVLVAGQRDGILRPVGLAIDRTGVLVVADSGSHRVVHVAMRPHAQAGPVSVRLLIQAATGLGCAWRPYVACRSKRSPLHVKTKEAADAENPVWLHETTLKGIWVGDTLFFDVWGQDELGVEHRLGKAALELTQHGFDGEVPIQRAGRDLRATLRIQAVVLTAPDEAPPATTSLCKDFRVAILSAANVTATDKLGYAPQIYCVCEVLGKPRLRTQTKAISGDVSPVVWNHEGRVVGGAEGDSFVFYLWNSQPSAHDELVGTATLSGETLLSSDGYRGRLALEKVGAPKDAGGTLLVQVAAVAPAPAPKASVVTIDVLSATGLRDAGRSSWKPLSTFCTCEVAGRPHVHTRSKVARNSQNPIWNHRDILKQVEHGESLLFHIWDADPGKPDSLIGVCHLLWDHFGVGQGFNGSLPLERSGLDRDGAGSLRVRAVIAARGEASSGSLAPPGKDFRVAILHTNGLEQLAAPGHAFNPFCSCELLGKPSVRMSTKVVRRSSKPSWGQEARMNGICADDSLVLRLWDKDMIAKRRDRLLGVALLAGGRFYEEGFEGDLELAVPRAVTVASRHPAAASHGEGVQVTLRVRIDAWR